MENSDFAFLFKSLRNQTKRRLVVANGTDMHSLEAVSEAIKMGIIDVTLTGDESTIISNCEALNLPNKSYEIIHCKSDEEAVSAAIMLVRAGKAHLIMKGLVSTDVYMRAILNKETGLLPKGNLLTHITLLKNPNYKKPLIISDVAIIPLPNLEQKRQMLNYLIDVAHKLGISTPKVAFIAATEKVIEKMPACADANQLKLLWEKGQFPESFCDGPMALDVAIDKESAQIKNIDSEVAGDADCLLFPNIESGNVFYKTNTKLCGASIAAIVAGTSVPTILSSRGDSTQTKLNSIAFAAMLG